MDMNSHESAQAFYNYHVKLVDAYRNDPAALEDYSREDTENLSKAKAIAQTSGILPKIIVESAELYKLMSDTFVNARRMNDTLLEMQVNPEEYAEELDEMRMSTEDAHNLTVTLLTALDKVYRSTSLYKGAAQIAVENGTQELFEEFGFVETAKVGE